MPEHLTHFSCLPDVETPESAAHASEIYNGLSAENAATDIPSKGFLLSIEPKFGGAQFWIRDDRTGDQEHLIQFVKRCAAEFGLIGRWGFQSAITCTTRRVNSFGGGAHVLDLATGETVALTFTDGWLAEALDGGDSDA